MKQLFFLFMLATGFSACNNNSESSITKDSADHNAHIQGEKRGQDPVSSMHNAMTEMMKHMKQMQPTGDPDHDFAMMMKHHHEGAIKMAKIEIENGKDEKMKIMARKMLEDQQKEIQAFDAFLEKNKPSGSSDYGQRAAGMATEVHQDYIASSSIDAMFASMMIPHHKDGIKMSMEYLPVARQQQLKVVANNMISSQQKEIQELDQWLESNKTNVTQ
ncbi:MAG: DUF305 domain-containing protein [Flavisolibacter sp.]|jgi:uncharacterized protein (DUF305 family)|nr:DUF305 domain-containing protein [Flavisolibacter sp.]